MDVSYRVLVYSYRGFSYIVCFSIGGFGIRVVRMGSFVLYYGVTKRNGETGTIRVLVPALIILTE